MIARPMSRGPVRRGDKRYSALTLFVEIVGGPVIATDHWSAEGFMVRDHDGDQTNGQMIHPILSVPGCLGRLPVTARVVQAKPHLVATFLTKGVGAERLLAPPLGSSPLTLMITTGYRTIDWSLSGVMLAGYRGPLTRGQRFMAMLQSDRNPVGVPTPCQVIRADSAKSTHAARFDGLSDGVFRYLEQSVVQNAVIS